MSNNNSSPNRIEIYVLWGWFESPSSESGMLVLKHTKNGDWTSHDETTLSQSIIPQERITRFTNAINDIAAELEPSRFNRNIDVLSSHFGSTSTISCTDILIEIYNRSSEVQQIQTSSNHAHFLPWSIEGKDPIDSFNPEISIALAAILPDRWTFKERLHNSHIISNSEYENEMLLSNQAFEQIDQPEETYEEQMEKYEAAMNKIYELQVNGEKVDFVEGKTYYTADQLRRFSEKELRILVNNGYDLSTTDETGQTALMCAAFPPFNHEQFKNLVAAGADVDAKRTDSLTGLMLACSGGMQATVPFWLDAGADVNVRNRHKSTALMYGAKNINMVEKIIEQGAEVAAKDLDGDTALDYAMDKLDMYFAGSRLQSIELLATEIGRVDLLSLKRSLNRAIDISHYTKVHNKVLSKMGSLPHSEFLITKRKQSDHDGSLKEFYGDLFKSIDLEITEIELAERIITIIKEVIDKIEKS